MANRDILKEAIADAKAVKETAIANAKIALEEAFTPFLQEKFAAKLAEIDEMEKNEDELSENKDDMDEYMYEEDMDKNMHKKGMKKDMDEDMYEEDMYKEGMHKGSMDEIDLDELLRELEDMEDDKINEAEESKDEESEDKEEEFDIENMSEEDLKSFIEDVISDMVKDGELEAGHEGMEDEEDEEDEEEVDLDELLREMSDESGMYEEDSDMYEEKHNAMDEARKMKKEKVEMKKELDEAYKALNKIQSELNEINLLNSKLLYSNKVFKAKNLTESQKVKVLAAFDKATSKKEAQLVYETVMENLNAQTTTKRPMTESVRGMASRVIAGAQNTKQPIIEVNSAFERMQKLAGIRK